MTTVTITLAAAQQVLDIIEGEHDTLKSIGCRAPAHESAIAIMQAAIEAKRPTTHTTEPGENLMGISLRKLGDETRWCEIMALNADRFPNWPPHSYYPVGTVLKLPPPPQAPQAPARETPVDESERMSFAVMEHLGPAALTGGKMSILEAFELGWKARAVLDVSRHALELAAYIRRDELADLQDCNGRGVWAESPMAWARGLADDRLVAVYLVLPKDQSAPTAAQSGATPQ